MNVFRFLANDAADAVNQIRSQLGPEAVVVSVTPLPAQGVSRLWRKPRIEVVACLPDSRTGPISDALSVEPEAYPAPSQPPQNIAPPSPPQTRRPIPPQTLAAAEGLPTAPSTDRVPSPPPEPPPRPVSAATGPGLAWNTAARSSPANRPFRPPPLESPEQCPPPPPGLGGTWKSGAVLHQMGLQPLYVESVLERARARQGDSPPESFAEELACVRSALATFWHPVSDEVRSGSGLNVFIGPPGSGKTTALCKWLAKSVLGQGKKVRAWRLDGRGANFPGLLDFYGEILGVGVEREWVGHEALAGYDAGFIDLPGVSIQDNGAIDALRSTLESMPQAQIHLVLNAAYDVSVLLSQARAFSSLPVSDLILTHLDEEKKRGKLWNLVIGTNFALRFLSGGQNIPGDFQIAAPERLLSK